jgi:hypothetical protein
MHTTSSLVELLLLLSPAAAAVAAAAAAELIKQPMQFGWLQWGGKYADNTRATATIGAL